MRHIRAFLVITREIFINPVMVFSFWVKDPIWDRLKWHVRWAASRNAALLWWCIRKAFGLVRWTVSALAFWFITLVADYPLWVFGLGMFVGGLDLVYLSFHIADLDPQTRNTMLWSGSAMAFIPVAKLWLKVMNGSPDPYEIELD